MTTSAFRRGMAALSCAAFLSSSCSNKSVGPRPVGRDHTDGGDTALVQESPMGLDLRLSDGTQGPPPPDRSAIPPAKKLPDAQADGLLSRLRPPASTADDKKDVALRPRSTPPPRTGETVKTSFPPPPSSAGAPSASAEAGKALEILRWSPDGEVPIAPSLSITFSQPMVAVTSQDDAAATVPVKLSPLPKGRWRWLGTRTLLFDPDGPDHRLPQATTFQVEIPAGVRSATGGVLAQGKRFSFTTPAPRLLSSSPAGGPNGEPTGLEPGIFLLFDQRVDPTAVLDSLQLRAGDRAVAARRLDDTELAKDEDVRARVAAARADGQDGRWIAVRPVEPLPKDTEIAVTVAAGTPSAEGPNRTAAAQSFSFHTYPPLRIVRSHCGWGNDCPPMAPFLIELNNPLDDDRWDDAWVSITPDVPGLRVQANGNTLVVQGATRPRTTYEVTLSGHLVDRFGQELGKDTAVSFSVGSAQPSFYGPDGMVVLDPAAKRPTLDVFTTNYDAVKVQLWRVTPADLPAWTSYLRSAWDKRQHPKIPGTKVFDQLVKTEGKRDELTEVHVDLTAALGADGLGHVIAIVEPSPWRESYDPPRLQAWIQSTRIAVDAFVDDEELVAWATRLADGKPVGGARLEIAPFGITGQSDDRGTARLALSTGSRKGPAYLLATVGNDTAFVTDQAGMWGEQTSWRRTARGDDLRWYVIDDRQMYRPGETVHLKGWLRRIGLGKGGDVAGLAGAVAGVSYRVVGPQGNELGKGRAVVNPVGGFDFQFKLPDTPNLGYAQVELTSIGKLAGATSHGFQIQEFRRPEFEVTAKAGQGPFHVGESADVTVDAKYYAGGGLAGAAVTWNVSSSQTTYTPPNRDDFTFGIWQPWWGWVGFGSRPGGGDADRSWTHAAKTDAAGKHILHLDFLSANPAVPMSVTASATVMDVNRQGWASTAALLVHPSSLYVGARTKKTFVEQGQPIDLELIGVDLDGKAVPGRKIAVRSVRLDWEYRRGEYITREVDPQECAVTSGADPVTCSVHPTEGGTYEITATIVDDKGRPNLTRLTVWVAGGATPPARDVEQETVNLIPDRKEYKAGDTAEILVQAPFYPAEGLLTVRRSGLVTTERFAVTAATHTLRVPITDAFVPNLWVQVDLVGSARRLDDAGKPVTSLPPRPAYGRGSLNLPVPPRSRTLRIDAVPRDAKVAPGARTAIDVRVADAAGKPVRDAEVAVIVVDEAILALSGYEVPSPIDVFYSPRDPGVREEYLRGYVRLARPTGDQLAAGGGPGGAREASYRLAGGAMADAAPPMAAPAPMEKGGYVIDGLNGTSVTVQGPIAVRSNFDPLAAWAPAVKTGADGRATVEVTMPDNLTRYRVIAVGVAGERDVGKGESAITARMPLMVRPSPPRFLNFGDTFQLPVVLQNQTDAPMVVDVAVRATNAALTDGHGRQVTVPANDRVEVRFPAAAEMAGTARFQIAATSDKATDAAEVALPVWTPATTEAFATYGTIDDGAVRQPVALPGKVVAQFGGLEVETSSTQLQALTDAFLYLVTYPFECSEQLSSRIAGIAALRDVLTAFQVAGMPKPAEIEERVATDLAHLASMQNGDGGFPIWRRGYESWPFLSVHVTAALARAKAKGYPVPKEMLDNAHEYLRDIERRFPGYYPVDVRRAITSYALSVRALLGDRDVVRARGLIKEAGGVDKLPMEAVGWLLSVVAGRADAADERKAILRHLDNQAVATAGAAHWTTSYRDGGYLLLASDRRADGIILDALIDEKKDSDLIPKAVAGLLAHRTRGRWMNTQENVFVLEALDKYFHVYEKTTPDFVARVWLGDAYAGDHAFRGRTTERHAVDIPMSYLAQKAAKPQDLVIQKDGKGRLYYRIGMTYAPASLTLAAADHGFVVERRYEAVDRPDDVVRQTDGTWKIKAGARVRVRLTMVAESRRYHVALVDPLPAGLEPMNPAIAVTGPIPTDPKAPKSPYWWWTQTWYEHQNLRDERAEAFAPLLWEGVHEYSYVARATTPGHFVVPPPKAEEMYAPETFGRGATDRVTVE